MSSSRPQIIGLSETIENERAVVRVALRRDGQEASGESEGPAHHEDRATIVANATLRAIESLTGGRTTLELVTVTATELGELHVAVCHVKLSSTGEGFVGSAIIHGGEASQAVVKVVLDAINRHLTRI